MTNGADLRDVLLLLRSRLLSRFTLRCMTTILADEQGMSEEYMQQQLLLLLQDVILAVHANGPSNPLNAYGVTIQQ